MGQQWTQTLDLLLMLPAIFWTLVQILEDESFEPLQHLVEELLENPDQNKQRGAAELMAGLLCGMVCSIRFSSHD